MGRQAGDAEQAVVRVVQWLNEQRLEWLEHGFEVVSISWLCMGRDVYAWQGCGMPKGLGMPGWCCMHALSLLSGHCACWQKSRLSVPCRLLTAPRTTPCNAAFAPAPPLPHTHHSAILAPLAVRQAAVRALTGRGCDCWRCQLERKLPVGLAEQLADLHARMESEWPEALNEAAQAGDEEALQALWVSGAGSMGWGAWNL